MSSRLPALKDLAKQLNLSKSTVSRALANHPDISPATRERVQRLATELNYQPSHIARSLRQGRSGTIGLIVPHITGYFFPEVIHGITSAATKAGLHVMICESNEDERQEKQNLAVLLKSQIDGVLVSLSTTTRDYSHFEAAREQGVPLVFFDRVLDDPAYGAVVLDDYRGAYDVVSHLLSQGRRRVAHFTGPLHLNAFGNRHRGYLDALQAHGIAYDEQLVHAGDLSLEAGQQAMRTLLALPTPPDAVFASYDLMAIGAMQVLKAHGLRIPADIALAGFSNDKFTALTEPALTSVDQQSVAMGAAAVGLLQELMRESDTPAAPRRIVLAPQLLLRESSLL